MAWLFRKVKMGRSSGRVSRPISAGELWKIIDPGLELGRSYLPRSGDEGAVELFEGVRCCPVDMGGGTAPAGGF